MKKRIQVLALLVAAGSLLAVPAIGQATHGPGKGKGKGHSKAKKKCVVKKGFVVKGTFVSAVADDPSTPVNETSVTITVTGANKHARVSGELADMNPTQDGTQVAGGSYTVNSLGTPEVRDLFTVVPSGYVPAAGDKVRIVGKVAVTRKKCAAGDSVDARYAKPDIRRVKIIDVTP